MLFVMKIMKNVGYVSLLLVVLSSPCSRSAVAFGGDCKRIVVAGEVHDAGTFEKALGNGLTLVVTPSDIADDQGGWDFDIVLDGGGSAIDDLNMPFRGGAKSTWVDTSYASLAQNEIQYKSRPFWFLVSNADLKTADAVVERLLWPVAGAAEDSNQRGLDTLAALTMGRGLLEIISADVRPGSALPGDRSGDADYGSILRLSFKVSLLFPPGLTPPKALSPRAAACNREKWNG